MQLLQQLLLTDTDGLAGRVRRFRFYTTVAVMNGSNQLSRLSACLSVYMVDLTVGTCRLEHRREWTRLCSLE